MKRQKIFVFFLAVSLIFSAFVAIEANAVNIDQTFSFDNDEAFFVPQVKIPSTEFADKVVADENLIGKYVVAVYQYGAGIAGVVAMFMLVLAGWKWLMAAGNAQKISAAKETINGVLIGLALLFGGQLLLSQISTNLVILKPIKLPALTPVPEDRTFCEGIYSSSTKWSEFHPSESADEDGSPMDCGVASVQTSPMGDYQGASERLIQCVDTLCPSGFACIDQTQGSGMEPCTTVEFSSADIDPDDCTCIPTECNKIDFQGGEDNDNDCNLYPTKEMCLTNKCYGEVGKRGRTMETICGQDQNNPYQECERLQDVRCESPGWCNQSAPANNEGWCCEKSNGADYCRQNENDCM